MRIRDHNEQIKSLPHNLSIKQNYPLLALKNFGDLDLHLLLGNILELYCRKQYTLAQLQ